jgi:CheY-like chemotaxis protein/anti-sigma regulatory factor (Ser/Thr protein kinase)
MNPQENHILIVDDEDSILVMLSDYFTSLTYPVTTTRTAEAALKILKENRQIALIITDIDLPGISGIELLKIVRETKPEIPVAIITGLRTLDTAVSAIKNGAYDYLTKPFELGEVRKVVEKVLGYRSTAKKRKQIFCFTDAMSIKFDVPTNRLDANVVAEYLARFLVNTGFCNEDEFHQFYVAFTETVINAIEHGNLELSSLVKGEDFEKIKAFEELREARLENPKYGNRKVSITFLYNQDCFSLTITDQGAGFNWKKYVTDKNQFYHISAEPYGRGFMLIHHTIDEVYFNEAGNSITLVKSKSQK